MAAARLSDEEIDEAVRTLPGWSRDRDELARVYRRRDFRDAVRLLDAIAAAAEDAHHHPDVCIRRYRDLDVRLSTHDAGGITERDVALARRIEELARD